MAKTFTEFSTQGLLKIESGSEFSAFKTSKLLNLYTFIISKEKSLNLLVDGIPVLLESHQIIALTPIQHLQIKNIEDAIIYQFNQAFYCIKDHDKEVGCAGLLFFGNDTIPIVSLDSAEQNKFSALHCLLLDEIETKDNIQAEMLRMLLTRFIIKTTRLFKNTTNNVTISKATDETLRQFNFLVETHFKEAHNVNFYAEKLNKSPKTLSNTFSKFGQSPLKIIHERLVLEAKRQLKYTDKSTKEIAYDIGFDDASHLSRLFKKQTNLSPTSFKKQLEPNPSA